MSSGGQRVVSEVGLVGDYDATAWVELFRDCFQWQWDGGLLQAKHNKKKSIRTGHFSRHSWPEEGSYHEQPNIVIEVFRIIKDEENRMQAEHF